MAIGLREDIMEVRVDDRSKLELTEWIQKIPHLSNMAKKKILISLKKHGITTIFELEKLDYDELMAIRMVGPYYARSIIDHIHGTRQGLMEDFKKNYCNPRYLATSLQYLDINLGLGYSYEGLRSKSIIQIYGEPGCGKSNLCYTLAMRTMQSKKHGGWSENVLFISSRRQPLYDDLQRFNKYFKIPLNVLIKNFIGLHITSLLELELLLSTQFGITKRFDNIGLVIIDNISDIIDSSHPRTFAIDEQNNHEVDLLYERDDLLNQFMISFRKMVVYYDAIGIIVNKEDNNQRASLHPLFDYHSDLVLQLGKISDKDQKDNLKLQQFMRNKFLSSTQMAITPVITNVWTANLQYQSSYYQWFINYHQLIFLKCIKSDNHGKFDSIALITPIGIIDQELNEELFNLITSGHEKAATFSPFRSSE
ncbi:MAG: hypothetical protein HeimC2_32000 [Candidatus Heimdallarchaeota archaeon LC_2]|nr:MAG: hypothetical protein HeimC2_32000 [Candidatus Heimdallarchaeota archaeon LC_2]